MTDLPTPVVVPAGHVVRVRIGGQVYQSPVRPSGEARAIADDFTARLSRVQDGSSFIPFADEHGRTISIRGRAVTAVEVGPPPPRNDRPRQPDVLLEAGQPDPTPTLRWRQQCPAEQDDWGCTWALGHDGPHVAGDGDTIRRVWPQP